MNVNYSLHSHVSCLMSYLGRHGVAVFFAAHDPVALGVDVAAHARERLCCVHRARGFHRSRGVRRGRGGGGGADGPAGQRTACRVGKSCYTWAVTPFPLFTIIPGIWPDSTRALVVCCRLTVCRVVISSVDRLLVNNYATLQVR